MAEATTPHGRTEYFASTPTADSAALAWEGSGHEGSWNRGPAGTLIDAGAWPHFGTDAQWSAGPGRGAFRG